MLVLVRVLAILLRSSCSSNESVERQNPHLDNGTSCPLYSHLHVLFKVFNDDSFRTRSKIDDINLQRASNFPISIIEPKSNTELLILR